MTTFDCAPGLRTLDGRLDLPGDRWLGPAGPVDHEILDAVAGPVLDVGCGPGRHVVALAERGVPALGLDVTPPALATARARGAAVLERSVFERVPAAGRWAAALLLDGNLGIGGDPVLLLRRVTTLLRPGGVVWSETAEPGTRAPARTVRLGLGGRLGPPFRWSHVAADELEGIATRASLRIGRQWTSGGRWFAALVP